MSWNRDIRYGEPFIFPASETTEMLLAEGGYSGGMDLSPKARRGMQNLPPRTDCRISFVFVPGEIIARKTFFDVDLREAEDDFDYLDLLALIQQQGTVQPNVEETLRKLAASGDGTALTDGEGLCRYTQEEYVDREAMIACSEWMGLWLPSVSEALKALGTTENYEMLRSGVVAFTQDGDAILELREKPYPRNSYSRMLSARDENKGDPDRMVMTTASPENWFVLVNRIEG